MENISLQEEDFVRKVCSDLDKYVSQACVNKVFVFPPLNNRLRFIIHRTVQEEYQHAKLTTFSIGYEEKRRTVICYLDNLRRPVFKKLNHRMPEDGRVQDETKCKDHLQAGTTGQCRARRPDMQLYVPRAQRNRVSPKLTTVPHEDIGETGNRCGANEKAAPKKDTVKKTKVKLKQEIHRPASVKSKKSAQKSADLRLDSNAVVPLENYNTDNCGGITEPALDARLLCSDDCPSAGEDGTTTTCNDSDQNNDVEEEVVHVEAAMFDVNDQICEINSKQIESETKQMETEQDEMGFVVQLDSVEINVSNCDTPCSNLEISQCTYESETGGASSVCKEEENEVQILDSDSVTASENEKTETDSCVNTVTDSENHDFGSGGNSKPNSNTKNTLEVLNAEAKSDDDKSWDSLFDDSGDCLDPDLMEELTEAVCSVNIQKPQIAQIDYFAFKVKDPEISDEDFGHIVEIYGFPAQFKTEDLMSALSPFRNSGYNIKWVDDTHALGVFPSQMVASDVLATDHPLIKTRPLSQAIKASKMKAKHCAEFLLPYKQRPETSATLARRLVTGALGITTNVSRQQREIERRKLQDARARKKLAIKQREAAWDGTLGDCTSETSTSNNN